MFVVWVEKTSWASLLYYYYYSTVASFFFNFLFGDRLILDALIKLEYLVLPIIGFLEGIILKILRWLLRIANIGSTWSKMSCTCPVIACLELELIPLICSPFKWPSLKGSRCCDSKGMSLSPVSTKTVCQWTWLQRWPGLQLKL